MNFGINDADFWDRYPPHLASMREILMGSGTRGSVFVLGDPADEKAPAAAIFQMPPDFVLTRHAHLCERVEVVISGSIKVDGRTLGPGDVMTARPGEAYGDHFVGPDGCTTVEIMSELSGTHRLLWPTGDGEMQLIDTVTPEAGSMVVADTNAAQKDE